MSFATYLVVKAKSHATYPKQPKLVTLHVNAALDQYSTTTSGGGGAVGAAPVLTSESPADGATVQSVSSIELVADHYVDWFNMRVTAPDGSVTTLDNRQGTSQSWSFSASAQSAYTVSGTMHTLSAGTKFIRLHLPRLAPGAYKLVLRASGLGRTATTVARIRISAKQPPLTIPKGQPLGIVVVRGAQVSGLSQLGAKLGPTFSVTTTLESGLLQAVDPRTSHAVAVLIDGDEVSISLLASLHAVLLEVQIVGLTTDPATALLARKAVRHS
jgi:hypothetical protein